MSDFHALTVSKIESLTPNAVAVTLEVPEALQETFQYQPGQYITIQHFVGEEELRRSYSLCSEANGKSWTVGIKKMEGGVFSVYANEDLRIDLLNNLCTRCFHYWPLAVGIPLGSVSFYQVVG